jgi:hypothetical protein
MSTGYEVLSMLVQPSFYSLAAEGEAVRNLWLGIDGAFLTLYGAGCVISLCVLMKKTAYAPAAQRDSAPAPGVRPHVTVALE